MTDKQIPRPITSMLQRLAAVDEQGQLRGVIGVVNGVADNADALLELGLKDATAVEAIRDWCEVVIESHKELQRKIAEHFKGAEHEPIGSNGNGHHGKLGIGKPDSVDEPAAVGSPVPS